MALEDRTPRCDEYQVAWICPVANLELLPARIMLDEEYDRPQYDTHFDENSYTFGSIEGHAVVIATCSLGETGNLNAGRLTQSLFKTFRNIRMALLVGIGGGMPHTNHPISLQNVHLGDVVVGYAGDGKPACVYYDFGRAKVGGEFETLGMVQNPDYRIKQALGRLLSDHEMGFTKFEDQLARLSQHRMSKRFAHPGLEHDRLYKAEYRHLGGYYSKCEECDKRELFDRPQRTEDERYTFVFHLGRIATGNRVIQDGQLRDQISDMTQGAICVEMEAAGVDINRRCLIIRGISDYADSHKSDAWRHYAAGKAAAFARELLRRVPSDAVKSLEPTVPPAPWIVPLPRPNPFVGRQSALHVSKGFLTTNQRQRFAIYGPSGCGKTALALEICYYTREQFPKRAVFWVSAVSRESFEQAYYDIGMFLDIPGIGDPHADVKDLVLSRLCDARIARWLMVVDNADDPDIIFTSPREGHHEKRLIDYVPRVGNGSVIFTTRTIAVALGLADNNLIELGTMSRSESVDLLRARLLPRYHFQLDNSQVVDDLLRALTFLASEIVQTAAYINKTEVTLERYTRVFEVSEQADSENLETNHEDSRRLSSPEVSESGNFTHAPSQLQQVIRDQGYPVYLLFVDMRAFVGSGVKTQVGRVLTKLAREWVASEASMKHWAIMVDDHVYELARKPEWDRAPDPGMQKNPAFKRPRAIPYERWKSERNITEVDRTMYWYTRKTKHQITSIAQNVASEMQKYDYLKNNSQHFVTRLYDALGCGYQTSSGWIPMSSRSLPKPGGLG